MMKIPKKTTAINDEIDEHRMYTQMVDPSSNASFSIMTNSNDTSHENTTDNGETTASATAMGSPKSATHVTNTTKHNTTTIDVTTTTAPDTTINDDTESIASHVSFGSSTDGIDILRAGNIRTPTNFVEWSQLLAARIVSSIFYKRFVLFCILLSSLLLAIRTNDQVRESAQIIRNITFVLHVLLILFTIEILLAIACFRELVLSTGWLCSDIVIICIVWYSDDSTFLILRAFRLIRALRKASSVPSIQWAVRCILHVLPRLTAVILVLIPSMIAIFAILFTNLYQDADLALSDTYTDSQQQYGTVSNAFHRLDTSALTLFQIMTGGRNWADISTTLMSDGTYPMAWLPLIGYIIISMFFAATLVIAIMCDVVTTVRHHQMAKVFEQPSAYHEKESCHRPMKNRLLSSLRPNVMDADFTSSNITDQQQLYHRLEQKLFDLNNDVEAILRMQVGLQESIDRLSIQCLKNIGTDAQQSSTTGSHAPLSPRQLKYQQQQLQPQTSIRKADTASSTSFSTALFVPGLSSTPSDEH